MSGDQTPLVPARPLLPGENLPHYPFQMTPEQKREHIAQVEAMRLNQLRKLPTVFGDL